jgi:membrane protein implicated in regulation of membrane protease activity
MTIFNHLTQWHWLVLALLLLIAEVLVSGGFLLWIGLSAAAVSLVVWFLPNLSIGLQMLLFGAGAILTSFIWWQYLQRHPIVSKDPNLNLRSQQYVGHTFNLIEPIINGRGKIRTGDSFWVVTGPDLPVGTKVKIIRADGMVLVAEAVE